MLISENVAKALATVDSPKLEFKLTGYMEIKEDEEGNMFLMNYPAPTYEELAQNLQDNFNVTTVFRRNDVEGVYEGHIIKKRGNKKSFKDKSLNKLLDDMFVYALSII